MKHLRFTTLSFLIVLLIVLFSPSSSGQSMQPSPQAPNQLPSSPQQPGDVSDGKSQPACQAPAVVCRDPLSQRRFKIIYVRPVPPKNPPELLPDPPLVPGVSAVRVANLSDGAPTEDKPEHSLHPGIFLRRDDGIEIFAGILTQTGQNWTAERKK